MTMDNLIEKVDFLIYDFSISDCDSTEEITNEIVSLFTPKLQWKSEEIRYSGGDILLSTVHTVSNYHTNIRIYEPVNGITHVVWNGDVIFEGMLEECKKYCSNKVLDDFLKLCE